MTVCLIAAMSENRVIGIENRLPWRLPADLARFKKLTWGHCLVMGRKTYESIGRALPGRRTIVLTRRKGFRPEGVQVAGSLDDALRLARNETLVFVSGGEEVYRSALPRAERIYLTVVHCNVQGDAFFPELPAGEWQLESAEDFPADSDNPHLTTFKVLVRTKRPSAPNSSRGREESA